MGYRSAAVKGFGFLGTAKIASKAIALLKIIIIARLLSPQDIGVFGLVTVILSLVEVVTETGINPFLIQKQGKPESYISTAWVVSIARGLLIGIAVLLASFFVPTFYNESLLFPLMLIASFIPIIKGLINPAVIFFQRRLEYHKDVSLRFAVICVEAVFAISLTLIMRNPIALVLAQVAAALSEVAFTWIFIHIRPQLRFDEHKLREVVGFGKWLNLTGLFAFLGSNADDLIIGKILGTTSLGYYQTAFNVAQTSTGEIGELGAQVVFPVYTRIASDRKRLMRAVFQASLVMASLLLVPVALLFSFPEQLVSTILGPQWLPAIPVMLWLTAAGYVQAINSVMFPAHLASGKARYSAIIMGYYVFMMISLLVPFATEGGLAKAGMAMFIARLLVQPSFFFTFPKILHEKIQ